MLLLAIIAVSYIGVGLPDSVLGTAWPAIYNDLNLPVSLAGFISMTVSGCTVISCLMSAKLARKFGTGTVAAVSTLLTAAALLGISRSDSIVYLFILSVPLGIGAGTVDAALNGFVALYCSASQMSYLHCFYGLGVTASPYLVSLALGSDNNWRKAYLIVGALQFVVALFIFAFLPYWKKKEKANIQSEETPPETLTLFQMLRMPTVMLSCLVFFIICATEYTAGVWSSTFFAEYKGFTPENAARMTTLFYLGMTAGRFASGVFGKRLGSKKILLICTGILLASSVIMALPFHYCINAAGLFLFGFGMGPTFPNLSYLVPTLFGRDISQSVIGIQLASTYVGIMIMPSLFGISAQNVSAGLYPYFLFVLMIAFAASYALMLKKIKDENGN